jgi:FkbM family methyltransferase
MFNNCDSRTNGEKSFYEKIKDKIDVIFDVGCRCDTEFNNFEGEVHYFEPEKEFIDKLSQQPNKHKKSYFNNFGLGNETIEKYYYPKYESFLNRVASCGYDDTNNRKLLRIKNSKEYMVENKIENVDFLKIDTEGYEYEVIKGFEDYIKKIKIIQFEYGGTFLDNNVKLEDLIKYLSSYGFSNFSYLTHDNIVEITDFTDHYQYCNIVCFNKNFWIIENM